MSRQLTREELDRLLIEALTHARHAEPEEPDPDRYPAQDESAAEHGVKRWYR